MRKIIRTRVANLFLILGVLLLLICPASGAEKVSLAGMIFAADWDEEGRITAVAVVTEEGREYTVVPDKVGRELFRWEGDTAEITGLTDTDAEGRKTLQVIRYSIRK